jgi:predicted FMN-binding regulatory protein PaiB
VVHVRGSIRAVDDAPNDYVDKRVRGIVGIVIEVDSILDKTKLSQNLPQQYHAFVIKALH